MPKYEGQKKSSFLSIPEVGDKSTTKIMVAFVFLGPAFSHGHLDQP